MLGWGIVLWFAGQYGLHAFSRLPRYSCALSLTLAVDDKGVLYGERDGKTFRCRCWVGRERGTSSDLLLRTVSVQQFANVHSGDG